METLVNISNLLISALSTMAGLFNSLASQIGTRYGQSGLLAYYLVSVVVVVLAAWKIVSLLFAILRFLILPAVILAWLGSLFFPYSFATLLPISAAGCSLVLLYKA